MGSGVEVVVATARGRPGVLTGLVRVGEDTSVVAGTGSPQERRGWAGDRALEEVEGSSRPCRSPDGGSADDQGFR